MKIEKADYVWAVLSFITVGITFHYGVLLYGLLGIYAAMVILFFYHIMSIRSRFADTEAAYGTVTGYRTEKTMTEYYYPIVEFETAENELISAVYDYPDKKKRYNIGEDVLINYAVNDPLSFFFAEREKELTNIYYRCIIFGGAAAVIVLILAVALG